MFTRRQPVSGVPFSIDAAHLARQREFSLRVFGPGDRVKGVLDHIGKEVEEVVEAPPGQRLDEWVDIIILGLDGALRDGWEPQSVLDAILAKQVKNEGRHWPDWRTAEPDKAIEHVRESLLFHVDPSEFSVPRSWVSPVFGPDRIAETGNIVREP